MPSVLYVFALAVFAQGTSEFMLSGLVTDIARDMDVSLSSAGLLTSAFAAGMIVGAPLMAVLSRRWPRRRALLGFLVTFLLAHVLGAVTTSFAVLVGVRVIGSVANAGFLAVALATATSMVEPNAKGRATSVLLGGITLACIAGVPAGALLGQTWGWRSAFWAIALISLPAVFAILKAVPVSVPVPVPVPGPVPVAPPAVSASPDAGEGSGGGSGQGAREGSGEEAGVWRELMVLRRPRLLLTLLLGALVNGGTFCAFTYLAPVVTEVAGFGDAWVPALLALFGVGSFLGVTLAGRIADTRPMPLLVGGGTALLLGWALFAFAAHHSAAVLPLLFVQGALAFAVGSTLFSRVLYAAAEAPTLAGGLATASFNVGAALGPWAGGVALSAGLGYRAPLWVSALMVGAAMAAALLALGARRVRGSAARTPGGSA